MEHFIVTDFLARFWGGIGLVFSLIFLLKRDFLKNLLSEFDHLGPLSAAMGFVSVMIGIASLSLYAKWTLDWRVIITIFGWATLIKGVRILVVPNALKEAIHSPKFTKFANTLIFFMGILSFYLFTKGF